VKPQKNYPYKGIEADALYFATIRPFHSFQLSALSPHPATEPSGY
jgi:hypothetical protein